MTKNITCDTDFYKLTHPGQYPGNLTKLYSYGESRVGSKYPFTSWIGLQAVVKDHFLQKVTNEMIDEGEEETLLGGGFKEYFNREVWEKVRDLGYLPIKIMSAPEGSKIPIHNVLFTIESTEPWFAKFVNGLESTCMHSWYPTTVATRSMYIKENIIPAFDKSSDVKDLVLPFAVNDFGYRGASSHESSARGGLGHLLHFVGSDNVAANRLIKECYGYKGRLKSVWATEHSVATSFGPGRGEFDYILHQLHTAPDEAIISIVIDSYDDDNFLQNVVGSDEVKNLIIKKAGRVVFRPDTGKPLVNVCRKSDILGSIFGFNMNSKGYKVLDNNVGLLQGDGMDEVSIPELYNEYIKTGWAADNVLTGSGGGLLQKDIDRDTQRFAVKASYGERDGVPFNIKKSPKSDPSKESLTGKLKLHKAANNFMTISSTESQFNGYIDSLRVLYHNGDFFPENFADILKRTESRHSFLNKEY